MCGITGIINLKGEVTDMHRCVQAMTDTLRHRGPDGEGFLFQSDSEIISAYGKDTPSAVISSSLNYSPDVSIENISQKNFQFVLGHRRLSIIDISAAGHQPMCDVQKKIWIVYNGEIYNHIELREELKQKGFSFRTNTDTEVILQSYLHWDSDCVNHFNGMWAFVIFDSRKNILFGSRDRAGVKPFYYYKDEKVFAFASEQKALLKLPYVKTSINRKAAAEFLAGDIQYIELGEENMFKNIFEIMPAQNFEMDLHSKKIRKWNYYSLKANTNFSSFNENKFLEYRNETEKLFTDAVKLRLRSDVPVGSCLSGGIDSSAIVSVMGKLISSGEKVNLGDKLNVFTLKFDEKEIDESHWAKFVVEQTNAEWNLVSPTARELLKDFQDLNYAQDIPVCSTGTYGQFQLMKRAKEKGIKVILDGQGGDELFGGYLSYAVVFWNELLRKFRFGNFISEVSANGKSFFNLKEIAKNFLRQNFISKLPPAVRQSIYQTRYKHYNYLSPDVIAEYLNGGEMQSEMFVKKSKDVNEALLKDFVNARLKMYLKYEDRSSMWHSIEARTPFADDHRLAEYVFSMPGSYKIHNGITKYLLREAMKSYLPKEIKERKDKLGFVTPIDKWMTEIKNDCMDLLDDSVKDFIDVKKIKSNPEIFFSIANHADGVRVFRIISFAVWKKLFNL
ncbi:MAG: asparagine synthase (glutamine-hydrolyzing) [Bacteroidetes bacterium]|nr:asparagine synthase (glutamine-hydrolyzing) [Bacteroidota bacterium]